MIEIQNLSCLEKLTSVIFQPPRFSFYDAAKPMYTSRRNLPPSKIDNSKVSSSKLLVMNFVGNSNKTCQSLTAWRRVNLIC